MMLFLYWLPMLPTPTLSMLPLASAAGMLSVAISPRLAGQPSG